MGRDYHNLDERLRRRDQEVAPLKTALDRLNEENAVRLRELADLSSRVAIHEVRPAATGPPDPPDQEQRGLDFLAAELQQLKTALIKDAVLPERTFVPGEDPLDGIISHLTGTCGGNVADQGLVGIRSASVDSDRLLPRNAADLRSRTIFCSKDGRNQWIEWDFKTSQIEATHYSIRTHVVGSDGAHLRNWVLEGRNGDESWTVLDERREDSQLNGSSRIVTFDVKTRLRVRVIRLRQTGVTHSGNRVLVFCALEFFGGLFQSSGLN
jgi:hypothetical protein